MKMKEEEKTLAGDVLLTSSYLSYVGCFGRNYRIDLLEGKWMTYFQSLNVSIYMCVCVCMYVLLDK